MTDVELPLLDETRCTGTGDCVEACPTRCLALANGRPWLARPTDCVSCGVCVIVCPTAALTLAPVALIAARLPDGRGLE